MLAIQRYARCSSSGTNADDCQWIVDGRDNHENTDVHDCHLPVLSSPRPTGAPTPSVAPTSSRPTEAPVTPAPTLPPFDATTPAPGAHTLILSEVIEGSSYNKVIEIFNPTNDPVELGRYQIRQIFNGQADAEFFLTLPSVMIQPGATFTVCNPAAHDSFLAVCDMTDRVNHNGNDAIFLIYGREEDYEIIDSFGTEPGGMPGPWTVCGQQAVTANAGLRRKPDVARGNTNWASSAGTTADDCEWVVLRGGNDATYTGEHESDFPLAITVSPTPTPTASPTLMPASSVPTAPPTTMPTTAAPSATPSSFPTYTLIVAAEPPSAAPGGDGTNQASGASGGDGDGGDGGDGMTILVVIIAAVIVLLVLAAGLIIVKKSHANSAAATSARGDREFDNPLYGGQQVEIIDSGTDASENTGYMDVAPSSGN